MKKKNAKIWHFQLWDRYGKKHSIVIYYAPNGYRCVDRSDLKQMANKEISDSIVCNVNKYKIVPFDRNPMKTDKIGPLMHSPIQDSRRSEIVSFSTDIFGVTKDDKSDISPYIQKSITLSCASMTLDSSAVTLGVYFCLACVVSLPEDLFQFVNNVTRNDIIEFYFIYAGVRSSISVFLLHFTLCFAFHFAFYGTVGIVDGWRWRQPRSTTTT